MRSDPLEENGCMEEGLVDYILVASVARERLHDTAGFAMGALSLGEPALVAEFEALVYVLVNGFL